MTITIRYRSIDGYAERRNFRTLGGARRFAHLWVGPHPDLGSTYAVSNDGVGKITVEGATLADLFPAPADTALTIADARKICLVLGLTLRHDNGEYRVNFKGGIEATAYYTNDLADAVDTARKMAEEKARVAGELMARKAAAPPRKTSDKKPRKPPRWGVQPAAQAYCRICGWHGSTWLGKGCYANAHGELAWHRDRCAASKLEPRRATP